MSSLFLLYRWVTFGLFTLCNAVVCSLAAWNMSFAQATGRVGTVDSYLIFLGAFGLLVIIPVVFVDIIRRNAVSSRVWFELCWLALFWIMYFAGAVAVTAISPDPLCDAAMFDLIKAPCNSARAVVAFTWIATATLFFYFFFLALFSIMHVKDDDRVWQASVRDYNWFETKQCLRSNPGTPVMSRFVKSAGKPPSFAVPKPRRPAPIFVHHRAGLSSKYEIEHFPDPSVLEEQPLPTLSQEPAVNALSMYPQQVQSSITLPTAQQQQQQQTVRQQSQIVYRSRQNAEHGSTSEPPPIRDWPRTLDEQRLRPSRSKRERNASPAATAPSVPIPPPVDELILTRQRTDSGKGKAPMTHHEVREREVELSRANTKSSTRSGSSHNAALPPPPPRPSQSRAQSSERAQTPPQMQQQQASTTPSSYSPSSARSRRPTGPRTRTGSNDSTQSMSYRDRRPPPLDLSYNKNAASARR